MTYELWNEASGNRIDGAEGESGLRRLIKLAREMVDTHSAGLDDLFIEVWDSSTPMALLQVGYLAHVIPDAS